MSVPSPATQVESKWNLHPEQAALAHTKLGLRRAEAEARQIYFFDTPALDLYRQGLILRARVAKETETTVKFRPMTLQEAGAHAGQDGFKWEIDNNGEQHVPACSFKAEQSAPKVKRAIAGEIAVHKLFSKDQEAFAALRGEFNWDTLTIFGPVGALVWKTRHPDFAYPYTLEQWTLATGEVISEISVKTPYAEAKAAAHALREFLAARGLSLATEQLSKTGRTLRAHQG